MNSFDIVIRLEEHAYHALNRRLSEGMTVEMEVECLLRQRYEQLVPEKERQQIDELMKPERQKNIAADLAYRQCSLL